MLIPFFCVWPPAEVRTGAPAGCTGVPPNVPADAPAFDCAVPQAGQKAALDRVACLHERSVGISIQGGSKLVLSLLAFRPKCRQQPERGPTSPATVCRC